MKIDPIQLEIFQNLFSSITEEMGVVLGRTAFSSNIKERRDYSCALFDAAGQMVSHAAHIPVHLGSTPLSVKMIIQETKMEAGDVIILNDPYKGGTHLPDITLVMPVFISDHRSPVAYLANRAHYADVGGCHPGSMGLSEEIYQEGLQIPPVHIVKNDRIENNIKNLIFNNMRNPKEREGDLNAQIASLKAGKKRLQQLIEGYGLKTIHLYMQALIDYAKRMTEAAINQLQDGEYYFEDYLDNDGINKDRIKIAVVLTVNNNRLKLDFTPSDNQCAGPLNAVYAVTLSAVQYVLRAIVDTEIPANYGCLMPMELRTRKGSIVDSIHPGAVAGGNVETSQRIVDVLLGAFSQATEHGLCAASNGSMNNIAFGGYDPFRQQTFTYYETIGGGTGATFKSDGENAIHSHMTNTLNTPIEVIENDYPIQMECYKIRNNSGGKGLHNGGDGIQREFKVLTDCYFTVLSERRQYPPYGILGGKPGSLGKNLLIRNNTETEIPSKISMKLQPGDIIRILTPGGGGYKLG